MSAGVPTRHGGILPALYLPGGRKSFSEVPGRPRCTRCGKLTKSDDEAVWLELDQRNGEFHDFGGIPEGKSQGCFAFGPDCAAKVRARAAYFLSEVTS